jgi:cytochrome c biogenesis protein CcdA
MIRIILGIVAGLVAAVVTVMLVEMAGHLIFPPPDGVDVSDPEQLAAIMQDIPLGAKIAVLVAWAAGIIVGGAVAILVAKRNWTAWVVGLAVLAMGALTMMMIPHPFWMMVATPLITVLSVVLTVRLFGTRRS